MKLTEYILFLNCRFGFRHSAAGKLTGVKWFFIVHINIVNNVSSQIYQCFKDGCVLVIKIFISLLTSGQRCISLAIAEETNLVIELADNPCTDNIPMMSGVRLMSSKVLLPFLKTELNFFSIDFCCRFNAAGLFLPPLFFWVFLTGIYSQD